MLNNLLSFLIKIINSVVVVGLYYGFLTTFSIGPSFLFLLPAHVIEEGDQKKVAATTGFMTGQLIMFISIYYLPLHLALCRPHMITALALPYLLFHFFRNNHNEFWDYGSTTGNSIPNFSIQCVFLTNLIFQLFNHYILPSSMLVKLINIAMFRCNNKMLFVTSTFVGWLIGHILFLKGLGLVVVWLRKIDSRRSNLLIRSKKYKRSIKYLAAEWKYYTARMFCMILLMSSLYYLGRMPSPIFRARLATATKTEQKMESEEERDVEKGTKEQQEGSIEEDLSTSSEEKAEMGPTDHLVKLLFDSQRWNQPFRYIYGAVRNEMSQYFFDICQSDGKERISFTYPPNLSIFGEMIKTRIFPFLFEKCSPQELWLYNNEQNFRNCYKELKNRTQALDNKCRTNSFTRGDALNITRGDALNILETRTRLCNVGCTNDDCTNDDCTHCTREYIPKRYDPLLNKAYRKTIQKKTNFASPDVKQTHLYELFQLQKLMQNFGMSRIFGILFSDNDYQTQNTTNEQAVSVLNFVNSVTGRGKGKIALPFFSNILKRIVRENKSPLVLRNGFFMQHLGKRYGKYLLTQKIFSKVKRRKAIHKKVLRWSYKLTSVLDNDKFLNEFIDKGESAPTHHEILIREFRDIVIFTAIAAKNDTNPTTPTTPTTSKEEEEEEADAMSLLTYFKESDFERELIKGSSRPQRRKVVLCKVLYPYAFSPLFWERIRKPLSCLDISGFIEVILRNRRGVGEIFKNLTENLTVRRQTKTVRRQTKEEEKKAKAEEKKEKAEEKKERKERAEEERIRITEVWDRLDFGQSARGCILLTLSIFRKYIQLPLLIMGKNVVRILLRQPSEWSEDFREWDKEVHVKCTYDGVPVSNNEFPENWLIKGIQIKILFPFCLKPWNKLKLGSSQKDLKKKQESSFSYLTVWGKEALVPFGASRKRPSFFKPVFTEFKKKIRKVKKKKYFGVLGKRTFLGKHSKEAKKWVIKSVVLITKKIREFSKVNPTRFLGLKEVKIDESRELKEEKDSSKQIIHESLSQSVSPSWTSSSFTENKMNGLAGRTSTIRNQLEQISKEKQKVTPRNLSSANKTNSNATRFEQWQIVTRRNARLICKLPLFLKFFIERIYTDIFLSSIHIPKMNAKRLHLIEFTKKIFEKSIYNNSRKQEIIKKKKKNPISFISKSLDNISNSKTNSHSFYDLSDISQAYVFYKLSKIQVSNSYKLRSVLDYQEIPFFPKPEIKYSFEKRGVVDSKLGDKKFPSYEMNQWKNWLRGHYQYNFYNVSNQKDTFQKDYRYDLLSSKFLDYDNKTEYFFYGSAFQGNKNQGISYTSKKALLDRPKNIFRNNFLTNNLGRVDILYMKKVGERKDFARQIINSHLISKKALLDRPRNIPRNNFLTNNLGRVDILYMKKVGERKDFANQIINSQLLSNQDNQDLSYLMIPEKNPPDSPKGFFDWMGMNEQIVKLKQHTSNLESWFFPEFLLLSSVYKMKPWFIPSKLLLLNRNANQNDSKKKKIKKKEIEQKKDKEEPTSLTDKEKKPTTLSDFESILSDFESILSEPKDKEEPTSLTDKEKKPTTLSDFESILSQPKDIEENSQRFLKKNQTRKKPIELEFFLTHYFLFQLGCNEILIEKLLNNIRIFCLLLKVDPKKILFPTLQTRELTVDIMKRRLTVTELTEGGVMSLEPTRLSGTKDGQLSMYQTIGISLIHRSKYQSNEKYRGEVYVSKKPFGEAISTHQRITETRKKTPFGFPGPETILSFKRRKQFRILNCFKPQNRRNIVRKPVFRRKTIKKKKHLGLRKLKRFLFPNYRLEDLACMNRYWFDTNNGSRFSMLRIQMYPRLKIYG